VDENRESAILALVLATSIIIASLTGYYSGIQDLNLLNPFVFEEIIGLISSLLFIVFVLALPIPFAILGALSNYKDKETIRKISAIAVAISIIAWIILLGVSAGDIILGVFFILSLLIFIEIVYLKQEELTKMVMFRSTSGAARKALFIIAIGLFIGTAMVELENQEQNTQIFGETVMELAFAQSGTEDPSELLANLIINTQKQTITSITGLSQFEKLREKEDVDVITFVTVMDSLEENVDSEEIREKVLQQLEGSQNQVEEILSFDYIRQQVPIIDIMAENIWIMLALSTAFLFLFFSNVLIANLAGIYSAALDEIIGSFGNRKGKKKRKGERKAIEVVNEKF